MYSLLAAYANNMKDFPHTLILFYYIATVLSYRVIKTATYASSRICLSNSF